VAWLRAAIAGRYGDLDPLYATWRAGVAAHLAGFTADTVVVSHFVAINAAIGVATGDDRLVIASLDNASVTTIDVVDGALRLVALGREADTLIR
jgi:broad specificity phosphatase PhoE